MMSKRKKSTENNWILYEEKDFIAYSLPMCIWAAKTRKQRRRQRQRPKTISVKGLYEQIKCPFTKNQVLKKEL